MLPTARWLLKETASCVNKLNAMNKPIINFTFMLYFYIMEFMSLDMNVGINSPLMVHYSKQFLNNSCIDIDLM